MKTNPSRITTVGETLCPHVRLSFTDGGIREKAKRFVGSLLHLSVPEMKSSVNAKPRRLHGTLASTRRKKELKKDSVGLGAQRK